jgi:carbamoyl-phosphate synthase large subunit
VPFVAKAIGTPIAKIAARVMAGEPLIKFLPIHRDIPHVAVKEAVFPFARFPGVDPVLSPEMKSTGEVMGIADDFDTAFLKAQQGSGVELPQRGTLFVSVKDSDKPVIVPPVRALIELGFEVVATSGTAAYLVAEGLKVSLVNKVAQGRPHIVDKIKDGEIAMIFNTTEGWQSHRDSASIRASALMSRVPYFTTAAASAAVVRAIGAARERNLEVRSLQDYYSVSRS